MQPIANGSKFWVKLRQGAVILNGGIMIFGGVNLYRGNEKFYEEIVMPVVRLLDAETAHTLSIKVAQHKLVPKPQYSDPPCLKTKVWGKEFTNPVGLAAGFDKQGHAVDGLLKYGFGFVEVGSVTPQPQPGNPKPRVFRLTEDRAVINRYGFNSDGHDVVYQRIHDRNSQPTKRGIMGVNLGKNKTSPDAVDDYIQGVRKFGPVADYLVINVSSPNTPGLRDMQRQGVLADLLDKVVVERNKLNPRPPLLVKISPDLSDTERKDIAAVVTRSQNRIDGLIISNTTVSRPESLCSKHKAEIGGLSGVPLKEKSVEVIQDMYSLTQGKIPIVGVGGIRCGQDAYDKIKAGASLIQLYTALVFGGPPVVSKIKRELEELLKKDGYQHISEAVGASVKGVNQTNTSSTVTPKS